jgi:TonB family protein
MEQSSGLIQSRVDVGARPVAEPIFLVKLEPWPKVFLRNLSDLFWPRWKPPLEPSSPAGTFWPDVFVRSGLPWGSFLESALYHATVIAILAASAQLWPRGPQTADRVTFNRADVVYYQASEYLPPLDTGGGHVDLPQKSEPDYAPQAIISVPPEPDNRTQTIVTPYKLKLKRELALPNVISWSRTHIAMPLAATERSVVELTLPALPAAVVAPPPSVKTAFTSRFDEINIVRTEVIAPAPQLPLAEQRALANPAQSPLGSAGEAVVPPPPSISGTGTSDKGGRLIALGIHPAALNAPIEAPAGNRRGVFAASPEGKAGAPGTPVVPAGEVHDKGNGAGRDGNSSNGIPPGLLVGSAPGPSASSAMSGQAHGDSAGGAGSQSPSQSPSSGNPGVMADAIPPRVTNIPHRSGPEVSDKNVPELEKKVFGDRKLYSMTLNMPNLNSAGGSWVIHFAELTENGEKGELVAPVATQKVDPAYPLELMHHNVQGTVTLYAVIHSDGSVGEVRVLRGVDERLDEYARAALSRWRFQPATKNGTAVALEAVVRIPFRFIRSKSNF